MAFGTDGFCPILDVAQIQGCQSCGNLDVGSSGGDVVSGSSSWHCFRSVFDSTLIVVGTCGFWCTFCIMLAVAGVFLLGVQETDGL